VTAPVESGAVTFGEDFAGCALSAGGNRTANVNGVAYDTAIPDFSAVGLAGWTGVGVSCAMATNSHADGVSNALVRVATGEPPQPCWVQTPPMDLSPSNGAYRVRFLAAAWNSVHETTAVMIHRIAVDGATNDSQEVTLSVDGYRTFTWVGSGGTAGESFRFAGKNKNTNRFFLDDVEVVPGSATDAVVYEGAFAPGTTAARVEGLAPRAVYDVTVSATDGRVVTCSASVRVRTVNAATVFFLR
jgi:hypothetical protein